MVYQNPNRTSRYPTRSGRPTAPPRPRHNPDVKPVMVWKKILLRAFVFILLMAGATQVSIQALKFYWSRTDQRMNPKPPLAKPEPILTRISPAPPPTADLDPSPLTVIASDVTNKLAFLIRRAEMFEADGDYPRALERYQEALLIDPNNAETLAAAGRLYLLTENYSEAIDKLNLALAAGVVTPELLNNLGTAHLQTQHPEEALARFKQILESYPSFSQAAFNAGVANLYLNREPEAFEYFSTYRKLAPEDPRPLREMARIEWNLDHPTNAIALLEAAIQLKPDWHVPYLDVAMMTARTGDPEKALVFLQQAESHTDPATIYQVLQSPLFKEARRTDTGRALESSLAQRAREQMLAPDRQGSQADLDE